MCGRFAASSSSRALADRFAAEDLASVDEPRFNVAPSQLIQTVSNDDQGGRVLVRRKWGLVPSWAKDATIGNKLINARAETLGTKASFRAALNKRRCLIPIDGYYEWQTTPQGKQPWFITGADGEGLTLAGLFERWKDPDGNWLETATIITTKATEATSHIHDRRPLAAPREHWGTWLSAEGSTVLDIVAMLDNLHIEVVIHPVSRDVGNVRNESPHLVEPIADPLPFETDD